MRFPTRLFCPALACCALAGCKANPETQPATTDPARPLAIDQSDPDALRVEERARMNDPQGVGDARPMDASSRRYDDTRVAPPPRTSDRTLPEVASQSDPAYDMTTVPPYRRDVDYDLDRRSEFRSTDVRSADDPQWQHAWTLPEIASQSDPVFFMLDVREESSDLAEDRRAVAAAAAASPYSTQSTYSTRHVAMSDAERRGYADASARRGGVATTTMRRATAVLTPVAGSDVQGTLTFEPVAAGVRVHGRVSGLTPGAHGVRLHELGDVTDRTAATARDVRNLRNIVADAKGIAYVDFVDPSLRLDGESSIVGRSIVIDAGARDSTLPAGEPGARVAVGTIGLASDRELDRK